MNWDNIVTGVLFMATGLFLLWGAMLVIGLGFLLPAMAIGKLIAWILGLSC